MKALLTIIVGFGLVLTSLGDPAEETTPAPQLYTRTYNLNPETFVRNLKQLAPPKSEESNQALLARFLKENNVEMGKQRHTSVFWDENKGKLRVRATKVEMDKIEILIHQIVNTK